MNSQMPPDADVGLRSKQLLHEAGYVVEGFPPPKPRGVVGHLIAQHHSFMAFVVGMAIGAVSNLLIFLGLALTLADQPREWMDWYFGSDGKYFFAVTIVIGCLLFPKLRRRKLA